MGLLDNIEKRMALTKESERDVWNSINEISTDSTALKEATYFTCLKVLSESIAKCNLHLKQETEDGEKNSKDHYLYEFLRLRPNKNMSMIDCMKAFITLYKHEGIAGLYIDRDSRNKVLGLYPAQIKKITIDDAGLIESTLDNKVLVKFNVCGKEGHCFEKDIILLKDFTLDGINTKSVKKMLKSTIDNNIKSTKYLNSLFDNGLTNKMLIQCTADISDSKELSKIQAKFNKLYSSNGRTFTVPVGFGVTPINLSLADAQFEQLKRMTVQQIAAAMGVKLYQLGDLKDTNNNSLEQQNISFLVDTLLIIFEQIEQEMDWKLLTKDERIKGFKIRFNINTLLRTDSKTQAEILTMYRNSGSYTINDVRVQLGMPKLPGGDEVMVASGTLTLEDLLNNNANWQKGGGKSE